MIEIAQFIGVIFGSSLVSIIASKIWDSVHSSRTAKNRLKASSLKLAFAFEQYALDCAINLINASVSRDMISGGFVVPQLPDVPDPIALYDNGVTDIELLSMLLQFPQAVLNGTTDINITEQIDGVPDAECVSIKQCATLGLEALVIAKKIRKIHDLPERSIILFNGTNLKEELERDKHLFTPPSVSDKI